MADFMDTATSVVDGTAEDLKQLLGGEATETPTEEVESEQPVDEEVTEVVDGEEADAEKSDESSEEEDPDEESAEDEEAEEAEEEESGEFALDESDLEYSQAAYERAAKVFSKNLKLPADQQFDPNNAKDRAALRELMERGENFKTLKQELEEAKAGKGKGDDKKAATEEAATDKTAEQHPPTEAEINTFISQSRELAKASLIPQVSMGFASTLVNVFSKALFGTEHPKDGLKLTQEEADAITTELGAGFNMMLNQSAGMITNGVSASIFANPALKNAVDLSTREIGLRAVGTEQVNGKAAYPDLDELVESGRLKAVFDANPEIAQIKSGDGRDPAKNYAAQVKQAVKIARGESSVSQVRTAVATGKKQAELRAKRLGASRVAAGNTRGIRKDESHEERTVREITSGGGSKFQDAVDRQAPMQRK